MPRLPLTTHGRAIVISAASIVLGTAIIGAAKFAKSEWDGKLDVAAFRAVRDSAAADQRMAHLSDSLWKARIDHRTHVTLCKVSPTDSECMPQ